MPRPPTPAFAQAVRQVLGIDDLIPRPGVVIPALRDPVTGPRIEAAHQAILASHTCRIADAAAMRMREKLAARKHPPGELEELVASEWACWFEEPPRRSRKPSCWRSTGRSNVLPCIARSSGAIESQRPLTKWTA